ncbi:hypothetical protein Dimus_008428 [Dionaea muscipula]
MVDRGVAGCSVSGFRSAGHDGGDNGDRSPGRRQALDLMGIATTVMDLLGTATWWSRTLVVVFFLVGDLPCHRPRWMGVDGGGCGWRLGRGKVVVR